MPTVFCLVFLLDAPEEMKYKQAFQDKKFPKRCHDFITVVALVAHFVGGRRVELVLFFDRIKLLVPGTHKC